MNHSEMHVNGQIHLNGLENFWSLIKRGLGRTYVSVEPFHLSGMWTSKGFATTIANMRRIEDQRRGTVQQSVRSDCCRSSVDLQAISREGGAEARGSFLGKRRGVKVGGNVGLLRFWAAFIPTPIHSLFVRRSTLQDFFTRHGHHLTDERIETIESLRAFHHISLGRSFVLLSCHDSHDVNTSGII
jgi:hypothetical protein